MTHDETVKLFSVFAIMQVQVHAIDELIEAKAALQDVKKYSNLLSETIAKKHKSNLAQLWDLADKGSTMMSTIEIYNRLFSVLGKMSVSEVQYFTVMAQGILDGKIELEGDDKVNS